MDKGEEPQVLEERQSEEDKEENEVSRSYEVNDTVRPRTSVLICPRNSNNYSDHTFPKFFKLR